MENWIQVHISTIFMGGKSSEKCECSCTHGELSKHSPDSPFLSLPTFLHRKEIPSKLMNSFSFHLFPYSKIQVFLMEKERVVFFHNYGISPEKMSSEFLNRETFSWKPVNLFLSHTLTEFLRSVITAWPEVYIFHAKWNASIVVVQNLGWKHCLLNKHVFVTNNLELCETVRSKSETNKWWQ